jgi:hypothetical protein
MDSTSEKSQLILTIQAMKSDPNLDRATPAHRMKGMISRRDSTPRSRNLTELEKKTILQYILDLDSRAFSPRLREVEDMANRLLAEHGAPQVGKRWASDIVKR